MWLPLFVEPCQFCIQIAFETLLPHLYALSLFVYKARFIHYQTGLMYTYSMYNLLTRDRLSGKISQTTSGSRGISLPLTNFTHSTGSTKVGQSLSYNEKADFKETSSIPARCVSCNLYVVCADSARCSFHLDNTV